jgi:hypothetical protein
MARTDRGPAGRGVLMTGPVATTDLEGSSSWRICWFMKAAPEAMIQVGEKLLKQKRCCVSIQGNPGLWFESG